MYVTLKFLVHLVLIKLPSPQTTDPKGHFKKLGYRKVQILKITDPYQ